LYSKVASHSSHSFQLCETNGVLELVIHELDFDDPLEKLNVIELLEKVGSTREGIIYLGSSGAILKLREMMLSKTQPFSNLFIPRIITFFGNICSKEVGILETANVILLLKDYLSDTVDLETQSSAITAFGSIGSSLQGLELLNKYNILSPYVQYVTSDIDDLRGCCLNSLGFLLKTFPKEKNEVILKLQLILNSLVLRNGEMGSIMEIVMPLFQNPFVPLHCTILSFFHSLAHYSWGVSMLLNHPGTFEYLTNRNIRETKEEKEWKYSVIQTALNILKQDSSITNGQQMNEMIRFVKQGVFFVPSEAITSELASDVV